MTAFPPSQTTYSAPLQPHRGTMILVFGILSFCICFIFGICAWTMGNADLRAMDEGRMDPEGRGLTQAGKICGMISVLLSVCSLALVILMWILMAVFAVGAAGVAGAANAAGG